ncbi:hypothetical protein CVT26_008385 [Gymnopilus dilepis]|uniref:DUF6534 domain-containing protein n=1 Tax=Gymnopilus dilepis TaxID=231916 RepID=A0A409XY53_9AGAR|nr:hypothetical protein CVT26_008385 [Gymnopilus dilepis]
MPFQLSVTQFSVQYDLLLNPPLQAIVAATAQSFFAFRIWIMSDKKWYIPFVATPAVCFQLCVPPSEPFSSARCSNWSTINSLLFLDAVYFSTISLDTVPEITQKRLLVASLAVGAAIDVSLSAGLCILLWKNYMTEGPVLKSTKLLLKRTILFSINTGMWTALSACLIIMIFLRTQTSDYMVFSYFHIMSPIYFATVLANLNARPYLRKQTEPSLPSNLFGLASSNDDIIRNPEAGEILGNMGGVVDSEIGPPMRDHSPSTLNAESISSASGREMAMPVL